MNWNRLDDEWQKTDEGLRDGVYQGEITGCRLSTSQDGRDWLVLDWLVNGVEMSKFYGLEPDKVRYLKKDLALLGVKLGKLSDIQEDQVRMSICGLRAQVKLVTKGQYQNLWVDKAVNRGSGDEEPPPYTDDDIPF